MVSGISGPIKWLLGKLATPADPVCKELNKYVKDWNYAHANDQAIIDAEANWDRVSEAQSLQDSDPKRAFDLFLALAEQGSVWSMIHLAWHYNYGSGVPADRATAEYWYRRAFDAGSERALLDYVQVLYLRGALDLCEEVCRTGAEKDWAPALYWLAIFLLKRAKDRRTLREVRDLFQRAAQQDCPGAQFMLAKLTMRGRFGVREIPGGVELMDAFRKRMAVESGGDVVALARSA